MHAWHCVFESRARQPYRAQSYGSEVVAPGRVQAGSCQTTTGPTPPHPHPLQELSFIRQLTPWQYEVQTGFVPGMRVPGTFYVNDALKALVFEELQAAAQRGDHGGFLPAVKQIANVAALPGIVKHSIALPDVHSGYGFAIGNVAAFDMDDPEAVVSPGGVGFDINCGVRLLRTNLTEADVEPVKERLAQSLFDHIPVGVGSQGEAGGGEEGGGGGEGDGGEPPGDGG